MSKNVVMVSMLVIFAIEIGVWIGHHTTLIFH